MGSLATHSGFFPHIHFFAPACTAQIDEMEDR